jgi:putative membrane protein
MALAVSAGYELFEWAYATLSSPQAAEAFVGSQGDPWDAQADMFMALCGATFAVLALARRQDRAIASVPFMVGSLR